MCVKLEGVTSGPRRAIFQLENQPFWLKSGPQDTNKGVVWPMDENSCLPMGSISSTFYWQLLRQQIYVDFTGTQHRAYSIKVVCIFCVLVKSGVILLVKQKLNARAFAHKEVVRKYVGEVDPWCRGCMCMCSCEFAETNKQKKRVKKSVKAFLCYFHD